MMINKFVIYIFLFAFSTSSFSGAPYPEEAHALTSKILDLMVAENICKARNNCGGKEFILRDGTSDNIYIFIFRANDLTPSIIEKIIILCSEAYYFYDKKMTVELKVYSETVKERNAWFSGVKPVIYLQLKGDR